MLQQISQFEHDHVLLWYLLQHSVSSYHKIINSFDNIHSAVASNAYAEWQKLKIHANHLERFHDYYHKVDGQKTFQNLLQKVISSTDHLLIHGQEHYPEQLEPYSDSPPLLFVQGNLNRLYEPQIAMVGSRTLSPHGAQIAYDFAYYFAEQGYTVTSGLALGIDAASHHGAIHTGRTIGVIGTGLDVCYPTEHAPLVEKILSHGGAVISEFLPSTPARKQHFPRRNRIISALSEATLVVEAGMESGSLITAKYAAEQGKSVFAIPGHIYSHFHQGCHQLIREGAILVDHPVQVLEDLNAFRPVLPSDHQTTPAHNSSPVVEVNIPPHLHTIYDQLDWVGLSIDQIALKLHLPVSELSVALVELELLGLCKQHAGRYLRT